MKACAELMRRRYADADELLRECFRDTFVVEPELTVSEWSDKHRVITLGDARGPWDTAVVPYMREPMDSTARFGDVHQVTLMGGAQIAKTEFLINSLFNWIDRRPGLCMYVYPSMAIATKQNRVRVLPAAEACPPIARRFLGMSEDLAETSGKAGGGRGGRGRAKSGLMLTFDRMAVSFTGSNSPSSLEGLPCLYVIVDELDRCHPDTLPLVRERVKAYPYSHVIVVAGTPGLEGEGIAAEYLDGDRRRYLVPCPHCKVFHQRLFSRVRWHYPDGCKPHEGDPVAAEREAWYVCPACKEKIRPEHLRTQSAAGVWVPEGCRAEYAHNTDQPSGGVVISGTAKQTDHRSYHIGGLMSGLMPNPLGHVARKYIRLKGVLDQNFVTRVLGDPQRVSGEGLDGAELRKRIVPAGEPGHFSIPRPTVAGWRTVPAEVLVITAEVDLQPEQRVAFAAVRGWSESGRESLLLWAGAIKLPPGKGGLEALDELLGRRYITEDGRTLSIAAAAIDSGDATDDVYEYCRGKLDAGSHIYPVKGASTSLSATGAPYRWSLLERKTVENADGIAKRPGAPGAAKGIPFRLLLVDTQYYKTQIYGALSGNAVGAELVDDPGAVGPGAGDPGEQAFDLVGAVVRWRLPADTSDEYISAMTSERLVRVKVRSRRFGMRVELCWQLRPERSDNHWWDAAVYGAALAEALGVRQVRAALPPTPTPNAPTPNGAAPPPGGRPALPAPAAAPAPAPPQSELLRRARENPKAYLDRVRRNTR